MKWIIYLILLSNSICVVALNANLPAYSKLIGISSNILGIIVSLNPLMSLIFSVPFAHISDKYNRMIVIFIGLFFYLIASVILVFYKGVFAFSIVKILEGISIAALLPSILALLIEMGNKDSISKCIGSFTSVLNFGLIVAPIICATIDKLFSLNKIFLFVLILSTINLIAFYFIYRMYKSDYKVINNNQKQNPTDFKDLKKFNMLLIISILLLSFAMGYANGLYDSVWAYYIIERGGDVFIINMTYLSFAIPVVLLSRFIGKITDKTNNLYLPIIFGGLITTAAIFSYGFIYLPILIVLTCGIEGMGHSALYPSANSALVKNVDENFKGRILGIFNSSRTAGIFIGSIVTSYLFTINYYLSFTITALFILITTILAAMSLYKANKGVNH